jgi:hypothetical protein
MKWMSRWLVLALFCLPYNQAAASTLACQGPDWLQKNERVVRTAADAITIAKVYAKALYGEAEAKDFEPRMATIKSDVWTIYGFTPGGFGRLIMKINAKNGCIIVALIEK